VIGGGGVTGSARTSMRVGDDGAAAGAFASRPGDVALHALSESVASSTDAVSPGLVIARPFLQNAPPDLRW